MGRIFWCYRVLLAFCCNNNIKLSSHLYKETNKQSRNDRKNILLLIAQLHVNGNLGIIILALCGEKLGEKRIKSLLLLFIQMRYSDK